MTPIITKTYIHGANVNYLCRILIIINSLFQRPTLLHLLLSSATYSRLQSSYYSFPQMLCFNVRDVESLR